MDRKRTLTLTLMISVLGFLLIGSQALAHGGGGTANSAGSEPGSAEPSLEQKKMQADLKDSSRFLSEMSDLLMRSSRDIQLMRTTRNADHDFMNLMVAHNQAAIEMAELALKYSKDAEVLRVSRKIIEGQRADNKVLKTWIENNRSLGSH